MKHYAAIIVGGGLAGCAAAIKLAQAGRDILLIEKHGAAKHKICGEFLNQGAQHHLAGLGIDLHACGAVDIHRLRLTRGTAEVGVALDKTAKSLSRLRLDSELLAQAAQAGAEIRFGEPVRKLEPVAGGWHVTSGGETLASRGLFLATGKHDIRHFPRPATRLSDVVAFKMHYRLCDAQRDAVSGHVELGLFDGGYAGLQMVEEGRANLCMVISQALFHRGGRSWETLMPYLCMTNPWLQARMAGAISVWEKPLAVANVPYGFIHRDAANPPPHLYRLGDQAAVIPSFCGDGMSIALHSAHLATQAFLQNDAEDGSARYHAVCHRAFAPRVRSAALLGRIIASHATQFALFKTCQLFPKLMQTSHRVSRLHLTK